MLCRNPLQPMKSRYCSRTRRSGKASSQRLTASGSRGRSRAAKSDSATNCSPSARPCHEVEEIDRLVLLREQIVADQRIGFVVGTEQAPEQLPLERVRRHRPDDELAHLARLAHLLGGVGDILGVKLGQVAQDLADVSARIGVAADVGEALGREVPRADREDGLLRCLGDPGVHAVDQDVVEPPRILREHSHVLGPECAMPHAGALRIVAGPQPSSRIRLVASAGGRNPNSAATVAMRLGAA